MRFVSLKEQKGWYTLVDVLTQLSSAKENTRYEVRMNIVRDLLGNINLAQAYEKLGAGRTTYGVGAYCLTCSKEEWPPKFWIGHC